VSAKSIIAEVLLLRMYPMTPFSLRISDRLALRLANVDFSSPAKITGAVLFNVSVWAAVVFCFKMLYPPMAE
jgi:hypothetical protein